MKKVTMPAGIKKIQKVLTKRSPEILTGIGIAGMITTTVLAVKATPKALRLIDETEHKKAIKWDKEYPDCDNSADKIKLTKTETIKAAWKPYIPAAVTGVCSVACIIGANSVHLRRNAALATAYQLSTTAFNEYKEKVVETIGEKKEKVVRQNIAKDKVENNPVSKTEVFVTGNGSSLFFDPLSGRYFESDMNKLEKAVNNLNWLMNNGNEPYISLTQLYDELNLSHTGVSDNIGWKVEDGNIELAVSAQVADDGRPCLVMDFLRAPEYGYDRYY